ncbi:HAD-IB family hydrolase, partial [Mycobacterium sp. ITM-2017-0098]
DRDIDLAGSYFYADGNEDIALMALVGHPRPVNPRRELAAMAAGQGWPVLRVTTPGKGSRAGLRGVLK